jgi:Protein of unknown function (DUF2971)
METPTPPSELYHYTSVHGVEGIISGKAIWATRLHYMNDSQEWLHALNLVKSTLEQRLLTRMDQGWLPYIADLSKALSRIERLVICAFSLTAMHNQLSQWRAYCPPDGGYNLSFDTQLLTEHLHRHGFALQPCIYDYSRQAHLIGSIVDQILRKAGPLDDEHKIHFAVEDGLDEFVLALAPLAPLLKHSDFQEEQEWRAFSMVNSNDSRMRYRTKGSLVIPHCVLDLEHLGMKFPITRVTVGPNNHQLVAMEGMAEMMLSLKMPITVSRSTTPLRNL